MNILLIYNPKAGNRTFKNNLDSIIEKFEEKGYLVTIYRIGERCDLAGLFSSVPIKGFQKVIIAGGDGTIHQVINALLSFGIDIPVGIYPVGTANDFAHNFCLPSGIEGITDVLINENYSYCDVGTINGKYFINVASFGCLSEISQKTETKVKNSMGIFSYYLKGIEELQNMWTVRVKVKSEQCTFEGEIYFMLIMNGRSAGGFKKIAPLALINDGFLDVYLFKKCPLIDLMALVGKVIKGEHEQSPYVDYFQTSKLTVECNEEVATDLDGEKGVDFPLEIGIFPQKLKINTRFNNEDGFAFERSISFHDVKTAFGQISNGVLNEIKRPIKELKVERNSAIDLMKLVTDLPKHNALSYINKGTLKEDYFRAAEKTLDNGYLYVVLSSTGSAAGELIRKVTKKEYSHASLSFDENLETIISYNGGENIYSPGLNQEMIEFFYKKEDANIIIYKLKVTQEQKKKVLEEVRKIDRQGSSYNILGLFVPYSHRDNIMFCSQFVYKMLVAAGVNYFEKKPEEVKPTDFVELDYKRSLEYHSQLFLKDHSQM